MIHGSTAGQGSPVLVVGQRHLSSPGEGLRTMQETTAGHRHDGRWSLIVDRCATTEFGGLVGWPGRPGRTKPELQALSLDNAALTWRHASCLAWHKRARATTFKHKQASGTAWK